jgi:hypothetical protein
MKQETKFQFSPRPFSRLVMVCGCLAAAMTFVAFNSVAQASFLEYSASAYGTYAFVGSTISVAKTAPVGVGPGCGTPQVGLTVSGTVLSVLARPIVTTGAINTSAATSSNAATATSDVHQISLLGGFITASEVKAVSTTSHDSGGFHTSAAGSAVVNLVIATSPPTVINAVPAPNTTILLSGFGKVVLNEQIVSGTATTKKLTVNMIHVYVTQSNVLGIAVGTQIIVADAVSGLAQVNGPGSLDGTAFGTFVNSTTIKSSATAPASVGCQGNALITNTQLGISVPNVLNSGTIQDTAQGSVTTSLSSSETTSTVQNVNLLSGIVRASTVHADAKATTTNGTTFNFSEGSGSYFTSLVVQGVAYANVAANTKLTLTVNGKTLGTLYLHRVIQGTNSITVRMIELVIASGNSLGLPAGMDIIVASASASLHSPAHP